MDLPATDAYRALCARDARFDGRLFVGVTSTGIYCRPVCRVRTPLQRNCRFFGNAASAECAGFRPCLRCRPELAPGLSLVDSPQTLARQAAVMIEQAAHEGRPVALPEVAARLGVTDRHLRRIFQRTHGVTPIDWLTTHRLLLAKQLLTDTRLPVTQVALASGFASLRRFHAAFGERYGLQPGALRREAAAGAGAAAGGPVTLRLGWRPPYDIEGTLAFFARRALDGVEQVEGASWRRTLALGGHAGWVDARFVPERHEVALTLDAALLPVLPQLLPRLRQALDLDAEPARIDPVMATVPGPARPGLRLPNGPDGFELAVRVILGQQVTVAAARTLTQRLVAAFGEDIATPWPGLRRLFPSAQAIARAPAEAIGCLGIVRQRVGAMQALAQALLDGRLALHRAAPLQPTLDALRALPGIGEWSAQLIAMRALAWPDAFPATDIGLLKALGTRDVAAVTRQAEAWRPWRAYAVLHLWHQLETTP